MNGLIFGLFTKESTDLETTKSYTLLFLLMNLPSMSLLSLLFLNIDLKAALMTGSACWSSGPLTVKLGKAFLEFWGALICPFWRFKGP